MSDRIKGITVTLTPDIRDDDAEPILNAIRMIKGVVNVTPHIADADHHIAVCTARNEIRIKVGKFIDDLWAP